MLSENTWMVSLVVMFGLFLVGVWIEARRSLRALAEEDLTLHEVECEMDYNDVLVRLEARTRLADMRHHTARQLRGQGYSQNTYQSSYKLG